MSEAATLLIEHQVKPGLQTEYEAWVKDISAVARQAPGYEGVNIVRPHASHTSYTILVRFTSRESLRDWLASDTRKQFLDRVTPMLLQSEDLEIQTGLEYWFTPSGGKPVHAQPYKQFLVTLSAIYPLTLVTPLLVGPFLHWAGIPRLPALDGLVVTAVIVFMMVYVVMPRYTRLMARWLFT
jgi:antibiotic biosynthesis monooxygenase (ABM) superfamily enzyme